MVCSTKTSALFLLDNLWAGMTLLRIDWSKDLLFSFLLKKRVSMSFSISIEWMRVQARALHMHFLICFDKEDRDQTWYRFFVVMTSIDNVVLRINILCPHPNIRDESSTKSEIRYSLIGRISFPRFRMSRVLSVQTLSPGELLCIYFDWFLVRGVSLPAMQLFVVAIDNILREVGRAI